MFTWGKHKAIVAAAFAAGALVLVPAIASAKPDSKKRPPAVSVTFDRVTSFTPANADPRLAAEFARRPAAADFKFTPAAPKGRPSQIRVAIRALRQKLEADPANPALILNEPAVGYRLVGAPNAS